MYDASLVNQLHVVGREEAVSAVRSNTLPPTWK